MLGKLFILCKVQFSQLWKGHLTPTNFTELLGSQSQMLVKAFVYSMGVV